MRPLKLRTKLLLVTAAIVLAVCLSLYFVLRATITREIEDELHKRGEFIADSVARQIMTPLLTGNELSLRLALDDIKRRDRDVMYIFLLGSDGRLLAHTFPAGFPREFRDVGQSVRGGTVTRVHLDIEGEVLINVAAPIQLGAGGMVNVGLSERPVASARNSMLRGIFSVLVAVLVLAGTVVIALAVRIIHPLEEMAAAAEQVGAGNLGQRVRVHGQDEIGLLAEAFNQMAFDLGLQQEERRRAEQSLLEAKTDLEKRNIELQKLDRMKDGLIRDVSHELKTPVAKQAMQIEILRKVFGPGRILPPALKVLDDMEDNVRRQEKIIRNILDLSRLEAGGRVFAREALSLDHLLSKVIEDHQVLLESHNVALTTNLEKITIASDGTMLWHVFANLLANAIKFRRKEDAAIRVSLSRNDSVVEVRIDDNGIGLTSEELERAFERFYQGSTSVEGSGVGLSICRLIVSGLGGSIRIESEGRGRGATAVVTLPAAGAS